MRKMFLFCAILALLGQAAPLRMAIPCSEGNLTPYTYRSGYPGWYLLMLVYDTLMLIDLDGVPRPWLAKSVEVSSDGLIWTITVRPDVRWHDGQPFTAADVKFSFELYQRVPHPRFSAPLRDVAVEAPDDRTVVLILNKPNPTFDLALADIPIVPKHLWEEAQDPRTFGNAVGTGPYYLAQVVPDQFYRLEANPYYFAGKPSVSTLILDIVPDAMTAFSALLAGQIDVAAHLLPPELVAQLQTRSDVRVMGGPGFASFLLLFNHGRPPFDDPRVRRILAGALDLEDLVNTVLLGYATVGSPGFIHPNSPWYNPGVGAYPTLSVDEANRALEELGYRDLDGDGIRDLPDGRPLRFELLTRSGDPIRIRTAELIAQAVRPLGISLEVRALEAGTVDQWVWPDFNTCKGRNYDLAIWGWSAPVMTKADVLGLFHSDCELGRLNVVGYANPALDQLLEAQARAVSHAERRQLLWAIQEIVAQDVPFVTLFYPDLLFAVRPAAHDRWVFLRGEGIIHKLSFLK
ncbi:MAG: ABC transporter substrate-binding protein [Candidatus Bipolaricaulaceae bacterium]